MKRNKITLNESQLRNILKESVKRILREGEREDEEDYDKDYSIYDEDDPPVASVCYNATEKRCSQKIDGDGDWYYCNLTATDWDISNDGIGKYEYWGQKCYDRGMDVLEVDDAEVTEISDHIFVENGEKKYLGEDKDNLTPEDEEKIIDYAIQNDIFEMR